MGSTKYTNRIISEMTDTELAKFCGCTTAAQGVKIRAKCKRSNWKTTNAIPAGMVVDLDPTDDDIDIIERDMLDAEHAAKFEKPWLVQESDGTIHQFDTDEAACAFQRTWRQQHGLDPMTGAPARAEASASKA